MSKDTSTLLSVTNSSAVTICIIYPHMPEVLENLMWTKRQLTDNRNYVRIEKITDKDEQKEFGPCIKNIPVSTQKE